MANLNKVMLIARLCADPEIKYIPSGTAVTELSLAVNRKVKQGDEWKDETCFVDVTVWGKQAENCAEYQKKGNSLYIEGRLQLDQWEQDGKKRSKLKVVAENVQFLTPKSASGNSQQRPQQGQSYKQYDKPKLDDTPPF